jgi:triacylglycerol lipase
VSAPLVHRVYLIPGMFGFGKLAGYDYFAHVEEALRKRFALAEVPVVIEVVPTPPTASIRKRAKVLADVIARSTESDDGEGPIHLIGHSTGGLDARVVVSPTVHLDIPDASLRWTARVQSVVTLNTPHFGTPLAAFFATVSGTRLLYAISLLTFATLTIGGPPLGLLSSVIAAIGGADKALGLDIGVLDRATNLVLRFVGDRGREQVRSWLDGIRDDQGGIIQIMPEVMDLFNGACANHPEIRYGSVATASPPPRAVTFASSVLSPYATASATAYSTIYAVTSRPSSTYPFPPLDPETEAKLRGGIDREISERLCDGIVPTLSMPWGELLWAGRGDHLDVVGHFKDDARPPVHVDWLTSGAGFDRLRYRGMIDAVSGFLLRSE